MRLLFELVHPRYPAQPTAVLQRRAARGIVLRGRQLLLLYTARYNDYSLPGGGVDPGEDIRAALCRELEEETGARNVRVLAEFGRVDESRPHRGEYDAMQMQSFVYRCAVDETLAAPRMESYEQANGMRPVWIDVDDAIAHNQGVIARAEQGMGLSIERETRLLRCIAGELLPREQGSGASPVAACT
jgi:8-oxo-dGTP pyrophosphatase MutT (NUDIX family)